LIAFSELDFSIIEEEEGLLFRNIISSEMGEQLALEAQEMRIADETASKAKTGPKPSGTGTHNKKISSVANSVKDRKVIAGGQRLPERLIKTPGGIKSGRRPDILVERPDGSIYGINVGKTTSYVAPIKRQAQAINDLEGTGIEIYFVPYDR
jgi:hypothetical protein